MYEIKIKETNKIKNFEKAYKEIRKKHGKKHFLGFVKDDKSDDVIIFGRCSLFVFIEFLKTMCDEEITLSSKNKLVVNGEITDIGLIHKNTHEAYNW